MTKEKVVFKNLLLFFHCSQHALKPILSFSYMNILLTEEHFSRHGEVLIMRGDLLWSNEVMEGFSDLDS